MCDTIGLKSNINSDSSEQIEQICKQIIKKSSDVSFILL